MDSKDSDKDSFGRLLGWKADPAGDNIALLMQSATLVSKDDRETREFRYFLTKQQAVQLGNLLYGLAGETPPARRKRGLLAKFTQG